MKKMTKTHTIFKHVALGIALISFASCKKDASVENAGTGVTPSMAAEAQAIAVSAVTGQNGDSIYIVGTCAAHHRTEAITFSSLPASVATYLSSNYSGYTFAKAYTDKDMAGNIAGYVVVINFNDKPVGLKFDASGAFEKVLEQREGHDLDGRGFHHGGRFDDRDGLKRDTIVLSALPSSVTSYFATNYAQDTLVRAFKGKDNSVVVLTINGSAYATVFDANGAFVKRSALPAHPGRPASINQEALPAAAASYLSTTYPNYVFKHAFVLKSNAAVTGYAVFIDANATKYGVEFDASGNFVRAITIR